MQLFKFNRILNLSLIIVSLSLIFIANSGEAKQKLNEKLMLQEEGTSVYNDHEKRDPFWQLVTPGGAIVNYEKDFLISDMILEGIIVGKDGANIAVINGIIVNPDDKIGLYIVKIVGNDYVVLQKGRESYTLKLKKEE